MSRRLDLKWNTDTLDLLAAAGSGWRATGWNPAVAQVRYGMPSEPVTETIDAIVERSSHDDLAESLQEMGRYARRASAFFRDMTAEDQPVWLRAEMTNEQTRQAAVRSIDYEILSPLVSATGHANKSRAQVRLQITREPFWEYTTDLTVLNDDASTVGGTITYSGFYGSARGRLENTYLREASGSGTWDTAWVGVRSADKHGDNAIDYFESVWDCEDGSNLSGGDCSDTADTDAHGGTTVICNFATNSGWYNRLRIEVSDITGYSMQAIQTGRYLMLLRCRVTSGTSEILALTGWVADGNYHRQDVVEVDETDYIYKEIGIIEIPFLDADDCGVELWARRTAGSGNLYMDCIVLIPVDEAFLKCEECDGSLSVRIDERNRPFVYNARPTILTNWSIPPGDGMVVVAAQRAALQDKDDDIGVQLMPVPCYLALRGGDV